MTDIGLSLAAAAVKIACKIWLRDHAIAAAASVEVADILKMKIANDRDRRRVQRQFDQLEETVADRIMTVLGHEFRGLDEGERAAAVWLVHDTLQCATLTDEDLFDADLDPIYLERHVRKSSPNATRDLSEVGTALYDRLLTECCTDIVELTTALPEFGPAAFTEILRRETRLIDMIRDLLDRVPARNIVDLQTSADAEFAASYRGQVVNRLDRLRLFGVTRTTVRYPLSVAYVSLNVASPNASGRVRTEDLAWHGRDEQRLGPENLVRIEQVLSKTTRLLIRGEAGSGKTTLLQWLAVRSARYDFSDQLSQWNALVPFFIQLRNYTDRELPEPADFVRQIGRHLADKMPQGWVSELMARGLALLLIDGVDELPAKQRVGARRWLRDLIEDFPNARYIVTSRPAAISDEWLKSEDFLASSLEPMSPSDVIAFVSKWHEAVRSEIVDSSEIDDLISCEQNMQELLVRERPLRQLATNPLMCALLCALHRNRQAKLPHDRIEIYDAALEMLLERRDFERGVADEIPRLSRRRKILILQALAYWLIRNGWSSGPRDRAAEQVRNCLATMSDISASSGVVLQSLLERSGVVREPAMGRIDFAHRTFQEYLAARAIIDDGDFGLLLQHAHDDLWQEVVVLAVGYAGTAIREELLGELLQLAREAPNDKRTRLHLVALACLETAPQIPVEPRKEIEKEATWLLPPTTMTQAEAVAKAGEFGLELLMRQPIRTAKQAVAAIRAASLVGGEEALRLIKTCSQRDTAAIRQELLRAWPRFDREMYAREVLSGARFWDLTINDPEVLPALRYIKAESVRIEFNNGYGDISPVALLESLRYLAVMDPLLTNVAPLQECRNLETLELWNTGRFDLGDLRGCSSLRKLDFDYRSALNPKNLRFLNQLAELQLLGLTSFEPIRKNLSPGCRLRRFGLWQAHDIYDLSRMFIDPHFSSLKFLLLAECWKLNNLVGLETWADTLSGLYLHAPFLDEYRTIGELTKLDFANLSGIPISDLSFTRNLRKLRFLHLGGTVDIPDLEPLLDLPELSYLYLHGRDNVDLTPLNGKKDLAIYISSLGHRQVRGAENLGTGSKVQGY